MCHNSMLHPLFLYELTFYLFAHVYIFFLEKSLIVSFVAEIVRYIVDIKIFITNETSCKK